MFLHVLARVLLHVLVPTVYCYVLARVVKHVLARVLLHVLARVLLHVLAYYSKTCIQEQLDDGCETPDKGRISIFILSVILKILGPGSH